MNINPNIFREYDIRGIAGKDLTEEIMECIGKAYVAYMKTKKAIKKGSVVVGRDGRVSSKSFSWALIEGITSAGMNVIDLGEVPTPLTYFAMNTMEVDGGLMITASHNPGEYNGLKVGVGKTTIYGEQIQEFRRYVEKGEYPVKKRDVIITKTNIVPKYEKRILRDVKLKRKLKVVVDAGNGVGGVVAVPLFEKLGCEVIPLYCEVDGSFPNHHPDPTKEEYLKDLAKTVKKHKADIGIAFDGDVDRLGGCDEKGRMFRGDQLLVLFARDILKQKPGATIIGEVKCSRVMYEEIKKAGGNPVMWRTGHSHIKAAMIKLKAEVAGEMSGHIFFKHRWYGFDDAIYSACRLLELLSKEDKPLSELLDTVPQKPSTPEIEVSCPDDKKFDVVKKIIRHFEEQGLKVIKVDGARVEFPDGWGLIRASNTSPKLVIRAEAETRKKLSEIKTMLENIVSKFNE
ncbi:MAG: phosphomannomutase/phosphoglucomutase [Candidatus Hydrogenedentes bacterium]|nr:phosphomannomutase/phosphoglucomutase [Candidatus Hydrogenedentota bacterium]